MTKISVTKICGLCGRGPKVAISRSHSMHATKRIQFLNLQKINQGGRLVWACSKCRRTQVKNKK